MSTPAPTAELQPATSGACRARAVVADTERSAMVSLIAERIFHSANDDGATTSPLMMDEARNLAGAVVDLIEECQPVRHLTPLEIVSELRGPLPSRPDPSLTERVPRR